jgi:hypothetical protein
VSLRVRNAFIALGAAAVLLWAAPVGVTVGAVAAPALAAGVFGWGARPTGVGAILLASYGAARHERSFKLSALYPLGGGDLVPGMQLGEDVFYTVLQTAAASQAVEQVPFTDTSKGKTSHGFLYTFEDHDRLCTWGGPVRSGFSSSTPSCQAWNLRSYNSQVFPFLSLQDARSVGRARRDGIAVTGVAGQLNVTTSSDGSTGTMNDGEVTLWVATASKLPVAITITSPSAPHQSVSLFT